MMVILVVGNDRSQTGESVRLNQLEQLRFRDSMIGTYHLAERQEQQVHDAHLYEALKRLRKENTRLQEEQDILKKAAAYVAPQLP